MYELAYRPLEKRFDKSVLLVMEAFVVHFRTQTVPHLEMGLPPRRIVGLMEKEVSQSPCAGGSPSH